MTIHDCQNTQFILWCGLNLFVPVSRRNDSNNIEWKKKKNRAMYVDGVTHSASIKLWLTKKIPFWSLSFANRKQFKQNSVYYNLAVKDFGTSMPLKHSRQNPSTTKWREGTELLIFTFSNLTHLSKYKHTVGLKHGDHMTYFSFSSGPLYVSPNYRWTN